MSFTWCVWMEVYTRTLHKTVNFYILFLVFTERVLCLRLGLLCESNLSTLRGQRGAALTVYLLISVFNFFLG